jgi:hypothetical protein
MNTGALARDHRRLTYDRGMAFKPTVPENFGRWAAFVFTLALILILPWVALWSWIASFNIVPDMVTDMLTTFSFISLVFVGAHFYMRWYLRSEGKAEASFPFKN